MAVGYDQKQKRFIVRNSWGPQWGQAGLFHDALCLFRNISQRFLDDPAIEDLSTFKAFDSITP